MKYCTIISLELETGPTNYVNKNITKHKYVFEFYKPNMTDFQMFHFLT